MNLLTPKKDKNKDTTSVMYGIESSQHCLSMKHLQLWDQLLIPNSRMCDRGVKGQTGLRPVFGTELEGCLSLDPLMRTMQNQPSL